MIVLRPVTRLTRGDGDGLAPPRRPFDAGGAPLGAGSGPLVAGGGPLRVALTALGCKVNYAEMAELAGALAAAGCEVVPDDEPADVRVVNSCAVTLQADATTRKTLHRLRRREPACHLVLTGCSVDANPARYLTAGAAGRPARAIADSVFANADKPRIAEHVAALPALSGGEPRPPRHAALRSRAFIKVQDGCRHRCAYCIVWRARGASRSVPEPAVLARAREALAAGHAELVLTGVDLGSYGRDLGGDLAHLLRRLLDEVGDAARIRLSSINANDITDRLIRLNADPRLCGHWHIPLQSGSDRILRAMRRGHRRDRYLRVVEALRRENPATELTTDLMAAFPGETDEDHLETLELIREVGFLRCHVFRYSPRPDTEAAAMPLRVDEGTARRRSAELRRAAAASAQERLELAASRRHQAVVLRLDGGEAHGLTAGYHQVVASASSRTRVGSLQPVIPQRVEGDRLRCTIVDG
ncbi:MAG TPA: MiaB/RimO family radical SAM methylthiotransferase [Candidatus Binatia bacterium]|nr:MiaB/RimO family radical SAM methylthiotransferase [Candidatus Binatia bacterium]